MKPCHGCGALTVDPDEMPRYDVLHPTFDPNVDQMSDYGPYGPECWASTITGAQIA